MAIRNDITIDWEASPRIVTVADTSTTVSIQELHDTLANAEMGVEGMDRPKIINSTGKEGLGDNVFVGITLTLQNAKLAFADRGGPSWIECTVTGGNLAAIDGNGDEMSPIEPTSYVLVTRAASSSATLTNNPSAEDNADAVWDELSADHVIAASLSKDLQDAKKSAILAFINTL